MRVYTVHLQRHALSPDRNAILIGEGFCWPAFVAGPVWALVHRMWFTALGTLAVYALILLGSGIVGLDPLTTGTLVVGTAAIVGFCANDWRRAALMARGWHPAGLAAAADKDAALRRFVDLHPDALNPPAPTPTY
ncbi:MAG: DUF2628 domain-containing protein [Alphaproteobacteria bacterium]